MLSDSSGAGPHSERSEKRSIVRHPLLYSSCILAMAALYAGWIVFSRWYENREIERRSEQERAEKQREADRGGRANGRQGVRHSDVLRQPEEHPTWAVGGAMLWSCQRQERKAGATGEPGLALAEPLRGRIAGKDDHVHANDRGWSGPHAKPERGAASSLISSASLVGRKRLPL